MKVKTENGYVIGYEYDGSPEIKFPDGIIGIGAKAFEGCQLLREIVLPNTILEIKEAAFKGSSLISIKIPDSVEKIDRYAFYDCVELINVKLPKKLSNIANGMFCYCEDLETIDIPDSVIEIGSSAFLECRELVRVTLSKNIKKIEESAFEGCLNLEEITIPEGVEVIQRKAFYECAGLTYIDIPDSIKEIGTFAFDLCNNLIVNLPDNLNAKIGYAVFARAKEVRLKAYNVFKQLSGMDKGIGFITVIRNYFQDKTYYSKEELDEFSEFILINRGAIFERALNVPEILRFMFEEIESVYTIDETRELAYKYCNTHPPVTAYLFTYLHNKLESMGTTEANYTQDNDELILEDYTPEELEQMNNNDDDDEKKQGL